MWKAEEVLFPRILLFSSNYINVFVVVFTAMFSSNLQSTVLYCAGKKHFVAVNWTLDTVTTVQCTQCGDKKQRTTAPHSAAC